MEENKEEFDDMPSSIQGSFVICGRAIEGEITQDAHLIKLSNINTICPIEDNGVVRKGWCVFYTYKDYCYMTNIGALDLQRAIDSFIFKPDEHLKTYGY